MPGFGFRISGVLCAGLLYAQTTVTNGPVVGGNAVYPVEGPAYLPLRTAIINAAGQIDGAVGPGSNCMHVDGSNAACPGGGSSAVTSFNARVGIVLPVSGDYTAAQVTNAADTTQTYADPPWITSLSPLKVGSGVNQWNANKINNQPLSALASGLYYWTLGVPSTITGTAGDCIHVDGSHGACSAGGGGGVSGVSQLLDFLATDISGTVQQLACPGPCNIRIGASVFTLAAPVSVAISGSSANGTVYWYLSSNQTLTAGHNSAATLTCSAGCTVASGITGFPPDSVPLWVTTFTANVWDAIAPGTMDKRSVFSTVAIAPGNGVSSLSDPTTGIQTLSTDPLTVPRWTKASGAPTGSCTAGRDLYTDTTNQHFYFCYAANSWKQADGGGGGGSGQAAVYTSVTFSATPTFAASSNTGNAWAITLTGNVTSSTLASSAAGQLLAFKVCQDSTGGRTFAWPTGFSAAATISPVASVCTKQAFFWDGSNAQPTAGATIDGGPNVMVESAAPSGNPPSGFQYGWNDSTDHTEKTKDSSGNVATAVVAKASRTANQFLVNIPTTGIQATAAIAGADLPNFTGDATTSGSTAVTVIKVNGTTVPVNSAADQVPLTTASAVAAWTAVSNCGDGTHALAYSTSTHTFACQAITGAPGGSNTQLQFNNSGAFGGLADFTYDNSHTLSVGASGILSMAGKINIGSDATGDIYYRDSSGLFKRLAIGGANTVLHGGTIPGYSAVAGADMTANTVTSTQLALVNTRRVCSMVIGADNGAALGTADIAPQGRQCFVPAAAHIVEIDVAADGGTPAVVVAKNHAGSLTDLSASLATAASGGLACANVAGSGTGIDGATTCAVSITGTTAAAGDWLETHTSASASTAKRMSISVVYTVD